MKSLYRLVLIPIFSLNLWLSGTESLDIQREGEAAAFFFARDYAKADRIYRDLSHEAMPEWKNGRVLYNRGTIKLALHDWEGAFSSYASISSSNIFSLLLLQNLTFNQAIAYYQKSKAPDLEPEERNRLLLNSLKFLASAQDLSCRRQKIEDPSASRCLMLSELNFVRNVVLSNKVHWNQSQLKDSVGKESLQHAIVLLQIALDQVIECLGSVPLSEVPKDLRAGYVEWMLDEANSLMSLWDHLRRQPAEVKYKASIETAAEAYASVLSLLRKGDREKSLAGLTDVQEQLKSLSNQIPLFESPAALLLIDYQLLLNQDILTKKQLESIEKKIGELPEQTDAVKEASRYLNLGLEQVKSGQQAMTRLFLWSSYYQLRKGALNNTPVDDPIFILEAALNKAEEGHQLNLLSQSVENGDKESTVNKLLTNAWNSTIESANPFIDRVLTIQTDRFRKTEGGASYLRCQQIPWNQVIPLFEDGYQSALIAKEELSNPSSQSLLALSAQRLTVGYWRQALNLLRESANHSGASSAKLESDSSEKDISEVFNTLQEMEAGDAPKRHPSSRERHSW
jgi:hypothetical protein